MSHPLNVPRNGAITALNGHVLTSLETLSAAARRETNHSPPASEPGKAALRRQRVLRDIARLRTQTGAGLAPRQPAITGVSVACESPPPPIPEIRAYVGDHPLPPDHFPATAQASIPSQRAALENTCSTPSPDPPETQAKRLLQLAHARHLGFVGGAFTPETMATPTQIEGLSGHPRPCWSARRSSRIPAR